MRAPSLKSELRAAGFFDPARAESLLGTLDLSDEARASLVARLADVADPDLGLLAAVRLADVGVQLVSGSDALLAVAGFSQGALDLLVAHPQLASALNEPADLETVTRDGERAAALAALKGADPASEIREHYYRRLLAVLAADLLAGEDVFAQVARALTCVVGGALEAAWHASGAPASLAVIAMGKTGGEEINYISDVDLTYVLPDDATASDVAVATEAIGKISTLISAPGTWPALWEIDLALRPEGKDGPVVRTIASSLAYYKKWAENWEFQALLKARPIAGNLEVGRAYTDAVAPLVWDAASRTNFVESSRAMRQRVEAHLPAKLRAREIKLGEGSLRDVEFTVQLLQMVHGRGDHALRVRPTLDGIAALRDGSYISRTHAAKLDSAYRFLRNLEHRSQARRLRRTHQLPTDEATLRAIARSMGMRAAGDVDERFNATRAEVRALQQEIYYRPLLGVTAALAPDEVALEPEAAAARLLAIGFKNPQAAMANVAALTAGLSRTAAIQRHILPAMLEWFSRGPMPDRGLASYRTVSEGLGATSWFMRLLRDSALAAERMAHLLSTSQFVRDGMRDFAESVAWLDDDSLLVPKTREALGAELDAILDRRGPEAMAHAGRFLRRRELLRTAIADILGLIDRREIRRAVTNAAEVAVRAALRGARVVADDVEFGIIAMGRYGSSDLNYASDADVMFVFRGGEDARVAADAVAHAFIASLNSIDTEPPLPIDADLRPEGKSGALVRSLDGYRDYYAKWVDTWERQALLKARYAGGNHAIVEEFLAMIDPLRYPKKLNATEVQEIRLMKARIERDRTPRGTRGRHLKLGPGGLFDIEYAVQFLQLRWAHEYPQLRVTGTQEAIDAAAACGVLSSDDAEALRRAWNMADALRGANVLASGRTHGAKVDILPTDVDELGVIAALMGVPLEERHEMEETYLRRARIARGVVEKILFEED
ncbi:glutamate-ammonia-ligase adenylyltransferase [Arcanobacterium wilhelmae]|uniref:Glutamate-ammonia-ligase adenylyltransferase n=1 Tax=Arcanobacterium wilhelmae TaxID=1803177 RepID=A0ABT9N9I7_9ACTO|nr:bifunctional [glutamine synthetase] adenylyltransferase/[glutamine synthetase]-adenylyl-L-tyrosine phosphorylase [Arcanobacterium wilhelmae]MDP9800193.1 glutamate-ammonia-ligase adenylyltransferase [Arcanobacterium wilhelmae]WFN89634.1 bifunctional [glutamine synthetase] adenylyltransferase/[glutamine synthetase]-adenylyl-L-tyrosine phosphorylase [Arcanobacterium wilhelmae]